eukprot:tig00021234_g19382.t1
MNRDLTSSPLHLALRCDNGGRFAHLSDFRGRSWPEVQQAVLTKLNYTNWIQNWPNARLFVYSPRGFPVELNDVSDFTENSEVFVTVGEPPAARLAVPRVAQLPSDAGADGEAGEEDGVCWPWNCYGAIRAQPVSRLWDLVGSITNIGDRTPRKADLEDEGLSLSISDKYSSVSSGLAARPAQSSFNAGPVQGAARAARVVREKLSEGGYPTPPPHHDFHGFHGDHTPPRGRSPEGAIMTPPPHGHGAPFQGGMPPMPYGGPPLMPPSPPTYRQAGPFDSPAHPRHPAPGYMAGTPDARVGGGFVIGGRPSVDFPLASPYRGPAGPFV